jgi:hypothetical protein
MNQFRGIFHLKLIISLTIAWLLIILGVALRADKADIFPADNNDDGLFYTWAGITFWNNPFRLSSHSIFEANNPALIWRSQYRDFVPWERFGLKITEPWLDHPPLGTAVIGLPAKLLGYQAWQQIPQLIVRFPALVASIFTLLFTYIIGTKLFGEKIGRLSLLFLATIPYFVAAHRQSFLDNILTPLFLACLVALLNKKLVLTAVFAFLCGWIKAPGFSVPFMVSFWFWRQKQIKPALAFFLTGLTSIIAYIGYGFLAGKDAFLYILSQQSARGTFVNSFFNTLTKPHFYGGFDDGLYVLSVIFGLLMLTRFKTNNFKFFNFFLSLSLVVIFLVAGRGNNSPWYWYPLIPFFSIGIGYYADLLLKKSNLFYILPFWLFGLTGFDLLKIDVPAIWLRLATLLFLAPYVLNLKKASFWLTRIFLALLIIFNIYVTINYPLVYCRDEKCPKPVKITRLSK